MTYRASEAIPANDTHHHEGMFGEQGRVRGYIVYN